MASYGEFYGSSTFFFNPGGDSGTRKALFDGMLAGSIPVIFEEMSLDLQYTNTFTDPRSISVFMNTTHNMIQQLKDIPEKRVKELQINVRKIRCNQIFFESQHYILLSWVEVERTLNVVVMHSSDHCVVIHDITVS